MQLFNYLLISLAINLSMFLVAFFLKTDKLTDFSYSLSFVALSLWAFSLSEHSFYSIILFSAILLWALRLGVYLIIRIIKMSKDKRFDKMRENFWSFLGFWLLQAVSVWLVLLPSLNFFAHKTEQSFPLAFWLGLLVFLAGFLIEAVADGQKFVFYQNRVSTDQFLDAGLWGFSRHPNYFGEILLWFGIYLLTLSKSISLFSISLVISPLYIFILLRFVSGIPLLEKSASQKFLGNKKYQQYKNSTNLLVPWWPKKN